MPALPPHASPPKMKSGLVLNALILTSTPDLDLKLLNESIAEGFEGTNG
jgi:hypothetical protein